MGKKKKKKQTTSNTKQLERDGDKFFQKNNYSGAISIWNRLLKLRGGIKAPINKDLLKKLSDAYYFKSIGTEIEEKLYCLSNACNLYPKDEYLLEFFFTCKSVHSINFFVDFCSEMIENKREGNLFKKLKIFLDSSEKDRILNEIKEKEKKEIKTTLKILSSSPSKNIKFLEKQAENDYFLFIKALNLVVNKKFDKAIGIFEKIQTDKLDKILHVFCDYYLSICYLENKNIDKSLERIKKFIEHTNKDYKIFLTLQRKKRLANLISKIALKKVKDDLLHDAAELWGMALGYSHEDNMIEDNLQKAAFLIANNYAREGELPEAVNFWKKLFKKGENNPIISKNLAVAYQRLNDTKEAIKYWEYTVSIWEKDLSKKINPLRVKHNLIKAYQQLGNCYKVENRSADYKKAFSKVIELDPQNTKIKSKLVEYYIEEEMQEEALNLLEELLEVEPRNSEHLTNMGICVELCGKDEEALIWWEKALDINPHDGNAIEFLCERQYKKAINCKDELEYDKSYEIIENILKKNPKHISSLVLKAALLSNLKKDEESEKVYSKAIELDPENPRLYIDIGQSLLDFNFIDKAEQYFEKAKEKTKVVSIEEIYMNIGFAYCSCNIGTFLSEDCLVQECTSRKGCSKARHYYELSIKEGTYELALDIAEFLFELKCEYSDKFAEEAYNKDKTNPLPLFWMAVTYFQREDYKNFNEVVLKAKESPDYQNNKEMQTFIQQMEYLGNMFKMIKNQ